jgi:hypothetical protein
MSLHIFKTKTSTTSGIASATTAAAANPARSSYKIQNLGQNALFVKEGTGATTSNFSYVLAAGTANDNGTAGDYESPAGQVYTGAITIAGTSPRYVIIERSQD